MKIPFIIRALLLLVAFFHCFFKYLQFVLLFASFVLFFEKRPLNMVASVVQHYRRSQIFFLKNRNKVAKSKKIWEYLQKYQKNNATLFIIPQLLRPLHQ